MIKYNQDPDDEFFASQLRKLRTDRNLSRSEIAEKLGISENTFLSYETNKSKPNSSILRAICHFFGTSADNLLKIDKTEGADIKKANGLQWRVRTQHSGNVTNIEDREDGIEVFRQIVELGHGPDELRKNARFSNYGISKLRELLLIALFSRSVELMEVNTSDLLQSKLIEKYWPKLKSCFVADVTLPASELVDLTVRTEAVALLAAKFTLNSLPNTGVIGLTGGTTIARFVDLVPPGQVKLSGINWVSLVAPKFTSSVASSSANNVVSRMVYNQPGSIGYQLPYISPRKRTNAFLETAIGDEKMLLNEAFMVLEKARNATQAYISIGSPEFNYRNSPFHLGMDELQRILNEDVKNKGKSECVGDVLLTLIDEYGNRFGSSTTQEKNDELVHSVGLSNLKKIADEGSVWILANRFGKARAIHGCIQAGYANCLVIDSITADHLLQL